MTVYNNDVDMQIWARATDFTRIDLIEQWDELHIDLKIADMSTWTLTLPTDEFFSAFHLSGLGNTTFVGAYGIKVFRNQDYWPLIAGPITQADRQWDGSNDKMVLTGMSDTYWLTTRVLTPDATHWYTWSGDWLPGYPRYTGYPGQPVESGQRGLLYYGIAEGCTAEAPDHAIPYFSSNFDWGKGSDITYWSRNETAYDMCKKTTDMSDSAHPLHFQVTNLYETGSYRIFYDVYDLTLFDISDEVQFGTDLGTVKSYSFTERRPEANYVIGGGPDFEPPPGIGGISQEVGYRLYAAGTNGTSTALYGGNSSGRIEEFLDCGSVQSSTPTKADIIAAMGSEIVAELAKKKINMTVEIQLEPDEMLQFGQIEDGGLGADFWLGATVSARLNQQVITDIIREVKCDFTQDKGEIITPTICDPYKFIYTKPLPFAHDNRFQLGEIGRNWH